MLLVVGALEFDYNHLLSGYNHLLFGGKDGSGVDVTARCEFLPQPLPTVGRVCELLLWYVHDYAEEKKMSLKADVIAVLLHFCSMWLGCLQKVVHCKRITVHTEAKTMTTKLLS